MSTPKFDAKDEMILSGFQHNPEDLKWNDSELAHVPRKRFRHAAVSLDEDRVLVIGGCTRKMHLNTTDIYKISTNEWTKGPTLNTARYCFAAVTCNNKVFVFGGIGSDTSSLSSIECLDVSTSPLQWLPLDQKLSQSRAGCAAVAVDRFVYIVGGYNRNSGIEYYLSLMEVFDTGTNQILSDKHLTMNVARASCVAALIGNKIWVVGGNDGMTRVSSIEYLEVDLTIGSPVGQWTMSSVTMLSERSSSAVAVVGRCLIIIGGRNNKRKHLSSVEVFDTDRDVCWLLPDMNTPRYACASVTMRGSNVLAIGGIPEEKTILSSVESLKLEFQGPQTLSHLCESKCIEQLAMSNIKAFLQFANSFGANRLMNSCLAFLQQNAEEILLNMNFCVLNTEDPELWRVVVKAIFSSSSSSKK